VSSVCADGTNYEPTTGQAPTPQTTNEEPTADPQSGSSVQCSVFSVQLDVAQPSAEQLVSSDDGASSTASGVASAPSNTVGNEANSLLPTEPNDRLEVERDDSGPPVNSVESRAPDAAFSQKVPENAEVAGPDTAPARAFPTAMELLLSIILVISCALWCLSASAADTRVRSIPATPAKAKANTVSPQRSTGVHAEPGRILSHHEGRVSACGVRTNTVSPQSSPRSQRRNRQKKQEEFDHFAELMVTES
jgi:hypothetical protein